MDPEETMAAAKDRFLAQFGSSTDDHGQSRAVAAAAFDAAERVSRKGGSTLNSARRRALEAVQQLEGGHDTQLEATARRAAEEAATFVWAERLKAAEASPPAKQPQQRRRP